MASECPEPSVSGDLSSVSSFNKMDDGVVVVVDSGQLESGTARVVSEDSTKAHDDLEESVGIQTGADVGGGSDHVKGTVEAKQHAGQATFSHLNNEVENGGLAKIEDAKDTLAYEHGSVGSATKATEGEKDLNLSIKSETSDFADSLEGTRSAIVNSADGKLLVTSAEILQDNNSSAGGERIQGKSLEVVVLSDLDGIANEDENIISDVKFEDAPAQDFVCEECGKRFTHISSKKRHMLKHKEGESSVVYQCPTCSKTFQYNSSLKRHLKLHSEETSGKAYTCKECSKSFMYATSLKRHLKTHSGKEIYPCPDCQRCFEYISSLKRHSKLHTEGKGFKCNICSKAFGYLSSLTRHQRVHQKSLTCTKCNKEFRLYKSYLKHLEQHGEIVAEAELAAMQVEESDGGEEVEEEMQPKDVDDSTCSKEGVVGEIDENEVSASMVAKSMVELHDKSQLDAIQGDVIDLQSAENHPFVKFVVSQNAVTLEQLQSFQASQAASNSTESQGENAVAYAVVHTDENAVIGENSIVSSDIGDLSGTPVGGIVLVEFDQNNKVTERHMEGLQASNLLQLLQAVEGFAVENSVQSQHQTESDQKEVQSGEQVIGDQPMDGDDVQTSASQVDMEKGQAEKA